MEEKKNSKEVKLLTQYQVLGEFAKEYVAIGAKLVSIITETLKIANELTNDENFAIYVGHDCGIPHTATDFNDTDNNGVAKIKVFEYIQYKDGNLTLVFEDGSESTNFAIDDIAYLVDDFNAEIEDLFSFTKFSHYVHTS